MIDGKPSYIDIDYPNLRSISLEKTLGRSITFSKRIVSNCELLNASTSVKVVKS